MSGLPEIGDIVDNTYQIQRMLGKGGFGAVFLAKHIPMDREVALKMLVAHGPDPDEMITRFRREVMAIRKLSHPNTVRIFDYRDSDTDTLLYYTMEYLKGANLKDIVRREGAQAPRRVKHILKQVAKSLSEAHSIGIVHRDLKPANIMLADMHGEVDFVKVLDFGIAKILEQDEDEEDPLTSAGMLVGTLRYMAPEQIKGSNIGPHTDLYSLGLIGAEMLSGKSIFAGQGRWDILQVQVSPDPIQLPEALHQTPLTKIITRLLAKDPAHRYPNAASLLADLGALSDHDLSTTPLLSSASAHDGIGNGFSSSSHVSSISSSSQSTPPPLPNSAQRVAAPVAAHASMFNKSQPHSPVPAASPSPSYDSFFTETQSSPATPTTEFMSEPTPITPGDLGARLALEDGGATKKKLSPLIPAIGLLGLLFVAGVGYIFVSDGTPQASEPAPTTNPTQPRELAKTTPTKVTPPPNEEPVVAEAPVAQDDPAPPREISLTSDTANVAVIRSGQAIGQLPYTLSLEEAETITLTLEAKGHETKTLTLDEQSPDVLQVELNKIEAPPSPHSTKKPTPTATNKGESKKAVKKDDDDWVPILDTPKKEKKQPKTRKRPKPERSSKEADASGVPIF